MSSSAPSTPPSLATPSSGTPNTAMQAEKNQLPPPPPPPLTARQLKLRAQIAQVRSQKAERERTAQVVLAAQKHTIQWLAVSESFEEWLEEASSSLLEDNHGLRTKFGDQSQVEPWPENGLKYAVVKGYMFWYVEFTRGVYGRAHVNHRTALNKMDLLYCAALRKCTFSNDRVGWEAQKFCRKNTNGGLYTIEGGETVTNPIMVALVKQFGEEFQEDVLKKKAVKPVDMDWLLRQCHKYPLTNKGTVVSVFCFFMLL
jgi:hypothetical protein